MSPFVFIIIALNFKVKKKVGKGNKKLLTKLAMGIKM